MVARSQFGKRFQKRVYDVLLDKTALVYILVAFAFVSFATMRFGEAWLVWSADKYKAIFNAFSDNLLGRSLQSNLCQYVPVDVVYTWVNGSDPLFLDDLKHRYEETGLDRKPLKSCPFEACVPSNMLTLDRRFPRRFLRNDEAKEDDLWRDQNPHLAKASSIVDPILECDTHVSNRSILFFDSGPDDAEAAIKTNDKLRLGLEEFELSLAYWTSDWTVPNSYPMADYFMLTHVPPWATENKLREALPGPLSESARAMWIYPSEGVAVVRVSNNSEVHRFHGSSVDISAGKALAISKANLISHLPYADDDARRPNRFTDFEQLRYSLRSVEKYAPWVRHIFLVTNGQIPHWLNLEHPKLTLVTHKEIFEDPDTLPTFSSPAIEANLHRIPNLSQRFIYFNDDIMLGKDTWPEDFFTENDGFKIRLSWGLPDCNANCPANWLHDGFCDTSCNTTKCMYDGGDCIGPDVKFGFGNQDQDRYWQDMEGSLCHDGCLDNWLGDNFCDHACDVAECAYDGGDCGTKKFYRLFNVPMDFNSSSRIHQFNLPQGITTAFWNLTSLLKIYEDVELEPVFHDAVRAVTLSETEKVLTAVLQPNVSGALVKAELRAKDNGTMVVHVFEVMCNTTNHLPLTEEVVEEEAILGQLPDDVEMAVGKEADQEMVKILDDIRDDSLNLTSEDRLHLTILGQQLESDEITLKGFNIKRSRILQSYVRRFLVEGGKLNDLKSSNVSAFANEVNNFNASSDGGNKMLRHLLSSDYDSEYPSQGEGQKSTDTASPTKTLDSYGESLLFVNQLLTSAFGHSRRQVPSHSPIFIDKSILTSLHERFPDEWRETAARSFRHPHDMQFSFSYTYFLMSDLKSASVEDIFDEFDTDGSSTWSDREIRRLLTRLYNLPLSLPSIRNFEEKLINCSQNLDVPPLDSPPPPYERYYDSKLPVVSKHLVLLCEAVKTELETAFRDRRRHKYQVLDTAVQDESYIRMYSDVGRFIGDLDGLRKRPVKFVCINDDTDPSRREDNLKVQSLLLDFLESVLPTPSTFELSPEYRNKFTHVSQMTNWLWYRALLQMSAYLSLVALVVTMIAGYFGIDLTEVLCQGCYFPIAYVLNRVNPARGKRFSV